MSRSTKDAWLQGPGDLREADVEDVPVAGQSVRVRGLPAAYSNQATSEALELVTGRRGEQTARVNTEKLEVLQFAHGVIDPTFSVEEARIIAQRYGPAFQKVVAKIDELSGVDKEAIEKTNATFQAGGRDEAGEDVVNGAPARTG
ncbi:MAG TPA: hypothetical protein VK595_17980 [Vicinamibacterales bacterium]|nr:hypothetical protein [Vicinamibacterales bacterium]